MNSAEKVFSESNHLKLHVLSEYLIKTSILFHVITFYTDFELKI